MRAKRWRRRQVPAVGDWSRKVSIVAVGLCETKGIGRPGGNQDDRGGKEDDDGQCEAMFCIRRRRRRHRTKQATMARASFSPLVLRSKILLTVWGEGSPLLVRCCPIGMQQMHFAGSRAQCSSSRARSLP